MKNSVSPDAADRKRRRRMAISVLLLLLLALLLFFWGRLLWPRPETVKSRTRSGADSTISNDMDSGAIADSLESMVIDTGVVAVDTSGLPAVEKKTVDSEKLGMKEHKTEPPNKGPKGVSHSSDTTTGGFLDSGETSSDGELSNLIYDSSEADAEQSDPCVLDTIPPWVFADPAGGLHSSPPSVTLQADDSAVIEWRRGDEAQWKTYTGTPVSITENTQLIFRAVDHCGNMSEVRSEEYELSGGRDEDHCPRGMTYIEISDARFCIDTYEWPNKKGARPQAFVSIYQAMDSCFTVGKRLCTTEEWSLACSGPYSRPYPYGGGYEPRACNTQDTMVAPSGSCPECRGYFGVQDMSGNLAEWTDTRSSRNRQFYNVMGGFWATGSNATCRNARYSYYPQNKHNPVGFRCCAEAK